MSMIGGAVLEAYSDSDWSVQHSTTGWVVLFGGAVVAWRSRSKQHSISMSSTEAEIIAASDLSALELVSLRGLLTEMGFPQDKPNVDNAGAVELSRDLKSCLRSRHVERRYLKVRELAAATATGDPVPIGTDNASIRQVAMRQGASARSKHLLRRYYVLMQRVKAGEVGTQVRVVHVKDEANRRTPQTSSPSGCLRASFDRVWPTWTASRESAGAGCAPTAAVWLAPTLRSLNRSGTMTVSHSARPEQSSRNGSMPTGLVCSGPSGRTPTACS
ncbi:hypothetical protein AB1Y20_011214 [Prymnesium parvum]|uniref:CDAN1-interacting nuclease 1 n=1 Tax=Prymnesium parvum TaxID=97485 RepID=A0AB34INW9_PRYPA